MPNTYLNLSNKKVLLAPLDWGLGHAARCVPLIKQLQQQNNTLVIACTKTQKTFLQNEINNVTYVDLFGYDVRYASVLPLWMKICFQMPRLGLVVRKENKWLANYLHANKTDVVVSDNRFGFYNKSVESIFITHQLNIQTPVLKKVVNDINKYFIKKFNAVWIPDYAEKEKRLSGELSTPKKTIENTAFIGVLSRFKKVESIEKKHDVLILLSGPEPQRTLLEEKLISVFTNSTYKIALVRGNSIPLKNKLPVNFSVINVASSNQLQELFNSSKKIICRSGYSTLMDLHAQNLTALLIPTPGQTEQEYLAHYWQQKFNCIFLEQKNITIENIRQFLAD
ncbi:MAG: glycosyltransferase [Bacteroidia bacterium]